jgi:hypothetical protein
MGVIMFKSTQPTKEQIRDWMAQRTAEHHPLPDIKQIRRELGWELNKAATKRR